MADDLLVDPDEFYLRYLETCAMNGIEPVTRERATALVDHRSGALRGERERTKR